MTLSAFLPGKPKRYAFAGTALAMMVPAILAAKNGFFASGTMLCGIADLPASSLAFVPLLAGSLGYGWGLAQSRFEGIHRKMLAREAQLLHEARHDSLTGLHNRLSLRHDVDNLLTLADEPRQVLLLLDLDRFKFVNDTLGHDAGDELLVKLADRLRAIIGKKDRLYRLGGDEFVILLDRPDGHGDVDLVCRTVETEAEKPYDLAKGRVGTGVSIGISYLRRGDADLSAPLKRADLALYKAKEIAGSAHVFFTDALAEHSLNRMELERDISKALADEEFFLEYQPIVGVETGAIRSFEALVRWRHPTRGVLAPQLFVPMAERSGVIVALGRWIMRNACLEAAKWPSPTGVAVNVAGDQFKDRTFVDFVRQCLEEANLAPGRLTIEVTESIFTISIEQLAENLALLRSIGVRIALDDFGTGFNSLNHLKSFPLDQLKIDRTFTRAMLADKRDAELVDLIAKLGETFKLATTIEGIETEGQLDFVRSLGVNEAQGFLISRPIPADQVEAFFAERNACQKAAVAAAG